MKEFKKSDLKTGMQVEYRDGSWCVVMLDTPGGDVLVCSGGFWMPLTSYTEVLKHYTNPNLDVVKVYSSVSPYRYLAGKLDEKYLIWEREGKPIVTLDGVEYSEATLRSLIKKATGNEK